MTLELQVTSETEARIREQAAAAGQDVSTFVLQAVNEKLADIEFSSLPVARENDKTGRKSFARLSTCTQLLHTSSTTAANPSMRAVANEES